MINCKSLNRDFSTKEEMFRELKKNEEKLISLKKAQKYESARKGQLSATHAYLKDDFSQKAGVEFESGYVYPVINTTRYMDKHDDVHFDGIWKKTLQEQEGKIYYVSNHSLDIDDVIAWPENVKAFTMMVDWALVGKDYQGKTEALIFKIAESDIQKQTAIEAIKQRRRVEGSVSMIYVKIKMAINSDDKEYAVNKAYYDSRIDLIANKEEVEKQGYFFGVEEARIYKEGSLVLAGSNDATQIIYPSEPQKSTPENTEPPEGTHKVIDYKYFKENFTLNI